MGRGFGHLLVRVLEQNAIDEEVDKRTMMLFGAALVALVGKSL